MKKLLPLILSFAMAFGGALSANGALPKQKLSSRAAVASSRAGAELPSKFVKCVSAAYDPMDEDVADYYIILTDNEDATWTKEDGTKMSNGYALSLDLYAPAGAPITLADGTYTSSSENGSMTYDPDYSYLTYYDESGASGAEYELTGDVVVKQTQAGIYSITATVAGQEMTFTGSVAFTDGTIAPSVYNQIRRDLDLTMNGALAFYDGNLYESNTGAMYINLYDHGFNDQTGGMTEDGCSLALMVFGKLFADSKSATLDPGTYTMNRNFNRHSWYPGLEADYAGTTVVLGSYAKERNPSKYSDGYGYSYLAEGTIIIEDLGGGVFKITVDAVTTLGNAVKATFEGTVPVIDQAVSQGGSSISTLEDDVQLDLSPIPVCRIFNSGVVNDCQCYIVDIGSPAGRDDITEGDIMRMEFVLPAGTQHLQEGTYTVMDEKYDTYYEPYKLTRGRWVSVGNSTGTDLSGTRYMHFAEGRYLIMDHHAPAASGTIGVRKNADDTWTFDIAVQCDAQFHIDGSWTGPMEYMYNPELGSGIDDVLADGEAPEVEWIDANTLSVRGADAGDAITVYDMRGVDMGCRVSAGCVDVKNLSSGIYVLKVNQRTIKIVKK